MAGFEVTSYGRFWVTAKERFSENEAVPPRSFEVSAW
jgi:hypothetical protein